LDVGSNLAISSHKTHGHIKAIVGLEWDRGSSEMTAMEILKKLLGCCQISLPSCCMWCDNHVSTQNFLPESYNGCISLLLQAQHCHQLFWLQFVMVMMCMPRQVTQQIWTCLQTSTGLYWASLLALSSTKLQHWFPSVPVWCIAGRLNHHECCVFNVIETELTAALVALMQILDFDPTIWGATGSCTGQFNHRFGVQSWCRLQWQGWC
jgi:hypothetical protein